MYKIEHRQNTPKSIQPEILRYCLRKLRSVSKLEYKGAVVNKRYIPTYSLTEFKSSLAVIIYAIPE